MKDNCAKSGNYRAYAKVLFSRANLISRLTFELSFSKSEILNYGDNSSGLSA